jgi:hypothetical protein
MMGRRPGGIWRPGHAMPRVSARIDSCHANPGVVQTIQRHVGALHGRTGHRGMAIVHLGVLVFAWAAMCEHYGWPGNVQQSERAGARCATLDVTWACPSTFASFSPSRIWATFVELLGATASGRRRVYATVCCGRRS